MLVFILQIEKHGGWDIKNSRQRLNEIVQRLNRAAPDYKFEMEGSVHNRPVFICKLTLPIKAFDKGKELFLTNVFYFTVYIKASKVLKSQIFQIL